MRRFVVAALLLVAAFAGDRAYAGMPLLGAGGPGITGATYTGPGDIVSGATVFYSLRAYTAAIAAAGTQSIVDLRRISDNATCTAKIATSGGVDLTVGTPCNSNTQTVTAWTNNDSSCTGAIATTTLTVASCTKGNLAVGLPITDANITAGTVITALGTGTGGAGTYTVNISQTAGSAVFTAPGYAAVSKCYCQPTGGSCPDATQGTTAAQPLLILSSGPSSPLPAISFTAASLQTLTATISAVSQPYSFSFVAIRAVNSGTNPGVLDTFSGGTQGLAGWTTSNNTMRVYAGSALTKGSIADVVWHAVQMVAAGNGTLSSVSVDGSTTPGAAGTGATGTTLHVGGQATGGFLTGSIAEAILWPSDTTSLSSSLNTNQHAYWGF